MATLRTSPSSRDSQVRRLYRAGASDQQIAQELGVTTWCIRQDRRYLGLLRVPTPADSIPDSRLAELHSLGLHNGDIATVSGLTRRTVQERLHRLGLRAHLAPR